MAESDGGANTTRRILVACSNFLLIYGALVNGFSDHRLIPFCFSLTRKKERERERKREKNARERKRERKREKEREREEERGRKRKRKNGKQNNVR